MLLIFNFKKPKIENKQPMAKKGSTKYATTHFMLTFDFKIGLAAESLEMGNS